MPRVFYTRKPLYNYRQREGSIVSSKDKRNIKNEHLFLTINKIYDYLIENDKFQDWKSVLLEIFVKRIWAILLKDDRNNIIKYANRTLDYIGFPSNYNDLASGEPLL